LHLKPELSIFLHLDHTTLRDKTQVTDQLLKLNSSSETVFGFMLAEVRWYIGDDSLVAMPGESCIVPNGVYLARAKWHEVPALARGPTPQASITNLRWLGRTSEVLELMISEEQSDMDWLHAMPRAKCDALMQMLNFPYPDPSERPNTLWWWLHGKVAARASGEGRC
jgi:hypothetical protein